jgi:hypothetical protein
LISLKYIDLLCEIWNYFPVVVEEKSGVGNYILTMLKRASRDKVFPLKVVELIL